MIRTLAAFAFVAVLAFAQDDGASVLARILAAKGTISSADLAQVEQATPDNRVRMLASLLRDKGVLSDAELAQLSPGRPATATVASAAPLPATAPTQQNLTHGGSGVTTVAAPVTADSKFPVTVYGTLVMNSFFNDAATNISDVPLFNSKQGSDALGNDKNFGMTARQTRVGLRYQGGEIGGAKLGGQVEVDFLGGKAPFGNGVNFDLLRLRLAFGRLDWHHVSFEAGQDWSVFAPLNPTSFAEFAIPSMSATGNPWIRMPQIRTEFHGDVAPGVTLLAQLAAIDPNMGDYSTATFSATRPPGIGERGRTPGADARFALTSHHDDRAFTVAVSSHYAHGKNSGLIGPTPVQLPLDSWGVAIDYSLPVTKLLTFSGEAYTGRALGIFSVTSGEAILAPGSLGDFGVRSSGGWAQAQLNFTRKWQMNLVYGIDDPRVRDLPVGNRSRNQSYMGNLMYKYTPRFTIAWEYRRILTDFRNQILADERGDHANLAFVYSF